jgi:hypothetical protein
MDKSSHFGYSNSQGVPIFRLSVYYSLFFQRQEQARIARTQTARVLLPIAAPKLKSPASPTAVNASPSSPVSAGVTANDASSLLQRQASSDTLATPEQDGKPTPLLDDRYTSDEEDEAPAKPPAATVAPVSMVPLKPAPPMTAPTATPQPAIPRPPAAAAKVTVASPVAATTTVASPVATTTARASPLDPPPSAMVPNRRDIDSASTSEQVQPDFSAIQWPEVKSSAPANVEPAVTSAEPANVEPAVTSAEPATPIEQPAPQPTPQPTPQSTPQPEPVTVSPSCAFPGCPKAGVLPCPACKKADFKNVLMVQKIFHSLALVYYKLLN